LANVSPVCAAGNLYVGRAFKEAAYASNTVSADFWILSAGLGLVSAHSWVPAYSLTVSTGAEDSIEPKISDSPWLPQNWWQALNSYGISQSKISSLIRNYPNHTFLISLSESYARLIQGDLTEISNSDLSRIRIFGLGLEQVLAPKFHHLIMPYDRRLDGPDSPIKGTLSDFSQRALRHYANLVVSGASDGSDIGKDRETVLAELASWRQPQIPKRNKKTDEEIRNLIDDHWDVVRGRSGRMLRLLRDGLGIACEQGRFQRLFRESASLR